MHSDAERGGDPWVVPSSATPARRSALSRVLGLVAIVLVVAIVLAFITSLATGPNALLGGTIDNADHTLDGDPWLETNRSGEPLTWACEPIRYRLVVEGAPAGATAFVAEGVQTLEQASGGTIDLTPDVGLSTWDDYEPGYRGITIGWAPDSLADWDDETVGQGGAYALLWGDYQSGDAWIHPDLDELTYEFTHSSAGAVFLHELAHAVGLGHVPDGSDSIMTPNANGITDFTPADSAALTELGQLACTD